MDIPFKLQPKKFPPMYKRNHSSNRCQPDRLGGHLTNRQLHKINPRSLVYSREKIPHKSIGVASSTERSKSFLSRLKKLPSTHHVRQHNDYCDIKKNGIPQIHDQVANRKGNFRLALKTQHSHLTISHQRQGQYFGRRSVKECTDNPHRDGIVRESSKIHPKQIRTISGSRSVRESTKSQVPNILYCRPNAERRIIQCLFTRLEQILLPLCIPSTAANPQSPIQMEIREEGTLNSNCPSVEEKLLATQASKDGIKNTTSSTRSGRHLSQRETGNKLSIQQKLQPSRISSLKQLLEPEDESLINMLSKHVGPASEKTYQFCWKKFYNFIEENNYLDCLSENHITLFFKTLIQEKLSYNSLLNYRSALSVPLRLLWPSFNLMNNINNELLFKYHKTNYKKPRNYFPPWDLDSVINYLISEEFRDKCSEDIEWYFRKVLFFCALASPKRISEFHAVTLADSSISKSSITLRPHESFIAKNHSHSYRPNDISIPSLPSEFCPVKLLYDYIKLSKEMCKNKKLDRPPQLWINKYCKPVSKNQIRHWIRSIILLGDSSARKEDARFHSVRGVVASNLYRHFDLDTVIKSMSWKASSTFLKHYSKLGLITDKRIVLAGRIINDEIN